MKRHALFVGVDQYTDGHIPNLACAVSDATDLHGFFKYGAGYDQVQLLPNRLHGLRTTNREICYAIAPCNP